MFLDREITPGLERELRRQQVVIAHSEQETLKKAKDIKDIVDVVGAASTLDRILRKWKGLDTLWSVLKGLRVLDLASGSGYSRDTFGRFYPHFSRLCAINGADVVAIDLYPQRGLDETMFEWTQADLVEVVLNQGLANLPILRGRQFDIVHSKNFVGYNFSPELLDQLGPKSGYFEGKFFEQAGELLAEGGVMSLDIRDKRNHDIFYTRKGSAIVEMKQELP